VLLIGEVAEQAGMSTSAIRYYEQIGLVRPIRRESGRRLFGDEVIARLRAISAARAAGFTLDEIRQLLDSQSEETADWRGLVETQIASVEARVDQLQSVAEILRNSPECECRAWNECPSVTLVDLGAG